MVHINENINQMIEHSLIADGRALPSDIVEMEDGLLLFPEFNQVIRQSDFVTFLLPLILNINVHLPFFI